MAAMMLEDMVHPLKVDHSIMLDGFAVICPECNRTWASMAPVGLPSTAYGYIRLIKAPCTYHGGSFLKLFTMDSVAYLPLYYGCLDKTALLQILLSEE